MAEPGGICIAESVFQQVKGKLPAGFTSLGAQKVKNIAEPVQAFRVDMGGTFKVVSAPAAKAGWRVPALVATLADDETHVRMQRFLDLGGQTPDGERRLGDLAGELSDAVGDDDQQSATTIS